MQKKKTTMCSRLLLQYYRTEHVYETCALRKGGGGKCLSIHYCIHNYLHGRTHKKKRKKKNYSRNRRRIRIFFRPKFTPNGVSLNSDFME